MTSWIEYEYESSNYANSLDIMFMKENVVNKLLIIFMRNYFHLHIIHNEDYV